MNKICCFFNYNPHYRYPIYKAMSENFCCDFYFGDTVFENIKQFPLSSLKGVKGVLEAKKTNFKGYVWHKGVSKLFSTKYSVYLLTGDPSLIANWLVMLFAKLTGKKVYLWTHGIHEHYPKWTSRFIYKCFYNLPTGLLMYGRYNWHYMQELGCKDKMLNVIHNSLDTEVTRHQFKKSKPSDIYHNHFANENPTAIYIGRLQKRKKIDQLIEAIGLLKEKGNPVNLVIVGAPENENNLSDLVKNKGLEDIVWFFGPSYEEKTNAELLYNASVCVCPAAVGLTAIHAMSYGCPVISNDNIETQMPEHESIIKGVTGDFFKEDSIEDLADKILSTVKIIKENPEQRNVIEQTIIDSWSVNYQIELLKKLFS